MWDIMSDLKNLGYDKIVDEELYETKKETEVKQKEPVAAPEHSEEEYLFDKGYVCPICNNNFVSKMVRTRKAKLVDSDMDLKPNYENIEPLKYDVVACDVCGYASPSRTFGHLTPGQKKMVRETVGATFKGLKSKGLPVYTYEEAEERYKLALINVMAMKGKNSERAYICLKLGWLYRSERTSLPAGSANQEYYTELLEKERSCIKLAYEGFEISYAKEAPPICGMDIITLSCLLADLARQCGDYQNAAKYVSFVLTSKGVAERIKDRARIEKDLIVKDMENK